MRGMRPVVVVTGRHRPHEQLLFAWGVLSGATFLARAAPAPSSITATIPDWLATCWSVGLVVSGLVGLYGCWRRGDRGLRFEQGALLVGAGSLLVYVVSAFVFAGARAMWVGGLVGAWIVANLWRAVQCQHDLKQIRQ